MSGDEDRAELLRQFEAAISGGELDDLHALAQELPLLADTPPGELPQPHRPELRRTRRDDVATYRIRVDIDDAAPAIWRLLDVRSDLTLDVLHQVLQAAFDWTDSHLHRFAIGGHPFDQDSQIFLCPFDVEEGEMSDDGGLPASDVRLDEVMAEPGDILRYLYDYGDSWEHTLRLEEVLPAAADTPTAVCVDGDRAAPPEDCGGVTDEAQLAEVLDDPAHFDLDEANLSLRTPYLVLSEYGVHAGLLDIVNRLSFSDIGDDLVVRLLTLVNEPTELPDDEMRAALRAHQWFLDRARGEGIELTSAGYLRPVDVEAASQVVPAMNGWIGKNNREGYAVPLVEFRESLQTMGLLRSFKGRLLLTRSGAAARRDPATLWHHLADHLVPDKPDSFECAGTLLLLAYAGSAGTQELPLPQLADALTELGWRHHDGSTVDSYDAYHLRAFRVLANVTDGPVAHGTRNRVSPAAAALARAALRAS